MLVVDESPGSPETDCGDFLRSFPGLTEGKIGHRVETVDRYSLASRKNFVIGNGLCTGEQPNRS